MRDALEAWTFHILLIKNILHRDFRPFENGAIVHYFNTAGRKWSERRVPHYIAMKRAVSIDKFRNILLRLSCLGSDHGRIRPRQVLTKGGAVDKSPFEGTSIQKYSLFRLDQFLFKNSTSLVYQSPKDALHTDVERR